MLTIDGNLTIECVADWKGKLDGVLLSAQAGALTLDLSQVQEFDGAGLQLLLAFDKAARAAGLLAVVPAPSPTVRAVLARYRLLDRFSVGEAQ